jgi:hypothetical protein
MDESVLRTDGSSGVTTASTCRTTRSLNFERLKIAKIMVRVKMTHNSWLHFYIFSYSKSPTSALG